VLEALASSARHAGFRDNLFGFFMAQSEQRLKPQINGCVCGTTFKFEREIK
jgi:hypothetical protein